MNFNKVSTVMEIAFIESKNQIEEHKKVHFYKQKPDAKIKGVKCNSPGSVADIMVPKRKQSVKHM